MTLLTHLRPNESQARLELLRAKEATGHEITPEEVVEVQAVKIRELKVQVRDLTARAERADAELREAHAKLAAEATMRPSLEVLQRMANGLDPFDRGRFQCAVAALPHETPRLSASVIGVGRTDNWGDQLDAAKARRRALLRVIDATEASD